MFWKKKTGRTIADKLRKNQFRGDSWFYRYLGLSKYNGFYCPCAYRKYLEHLLEKLRYELDYVLPYQLPGQNAKRSAINRIINSLKKVQESQKGQYSILRMHYPLEGATLTAKEKRRNKFVLTMCRIQLAYIQKAIKEVEGATQDYNIELDSKKPRKCIYRWTHKIKLHFIQLFYALFIAGYINNGEGEIGAFLEDVADFFGIDLGDAPSNHSKSIHERKSGYKLRIFDRLKEVYSHHRKDLQDEQDSL